MKLVWLSSGDEIEVTPSDQELAEYYVNAIAPYNNFVCTESGIETEKATKLIWALEDINRFVTEHKIAPAFAMGNPYDQQYLNELHRAWVKFSLATPKFVTLLRQKDPDLVGHFRSINKLLHGIEKMFVQKWANIDHGDIRTVSNPFVNALSHDIANVQIVFHDLGRSTFNKWIYFDNNLDSQDTNDFINLPIEIEIDLSRPISVQPPKNYVEWCNNNGIASPPGRWLNLGNLKDLEQRLLDYRCILIRNRTVDMFLVM
jgi:hypothetical protein